MSMRVKKVGGRNLAKKIQCATIQNSPSEGCFYRTISTMGKRLALATVLCLIFLVKPTVAGYGQDKINKIRDKVVPTAEAAVWKNTEEKNAKQTYNVWATAYSSTPEETDDTPFITASMTEVRDGIVAANFLPFGTKILIPGVFGDKIFTVEDRMHERKANFIDIWMPTKEKAQEFGITYAEIVILD